MAVAEVTGRPVQAGARADRPRTDATWTRGDWVRTAAWLVVAFAARGALAARIEGVLDDDQSVVGLMALDIAAGRRLPIFFDGQRYMGAVEAYVAAVFEWLLGHSPAVVALAPTLFFALFAAGQYALWRTWADRATGHLAALLTVVGAPMLALWGVAPRGGYSEVLAWAVLALGIYRAVTRPGAAPRPRWLQVAAGLGLGLGYFLNPLSLIVYATMALDWTLGRQGRDLRRERRLADGWVDAPWAGATWLAAAALAVAALAAGCHVALDSATHQPRYVFALGRAPAVVGVAIVAAVLGLAAWWTGGVMRLVRAVLAQPWSALGAALAFAPALAYHLRVATGRAPHDPSLPMWIRAPWQVLPNLRDGLWALGALVGCDPRAAAFSLVSLPSFRLPPPTWPRLTAALVGLAPATAALALALVAMAAWRNRRSWRGFWSLRGARPTPPTVLALLGLGVTAGMYLLQATSPDASSVRYLLPAWVFLPGLLAVGLRAWPRPARLAALAALLVPWTAAQATLRADMGRTSPLRPLVAELERRGVRGVVAPTPIALPVANLSAGRVGAAVYQPVWPRLRGRYADRFPAGRPVTCLLDLAHPRSSDGDLARRLRELARLHPGRVRPAWRSGDFQAWEADLPLTTVLGTDRSP